MAALVEKKFLTSFKDKGRDGLSFNDKYPFIKEHADTLNVEIMTIEDVVLLYVSDPQFLISVVAYLQTLPSTRNIQILIDQINQYGVLGEAARIIGKAGSACVKSRTHKLNDVEKKSIHDLAMFVDNGAGLTSDWNKVCEYYHDVFIHPEKYRFSLPGSAKDLLQNTLFKDLLRNHLSDRFVSLCMRNLKKEISDEYIGGIIENALTDVSHEDKDHIVIVTVSKDYPYNIISFIGAEKGLNNDMHGELICSMEGGPKGTGKLQMASTLLCARDAGIEFVFIQAIQGLFGVQHALYSRFGFETDFPPELLERETALKQCMFNPLSESMSKLAGSGNSIVTSFLDECRLNYFKRPNPINWILSMPSRVIESFTLTPMWIYAPNVNTICIKNMIEKEGWDCRVGPPGGKGGKELIDSRSFAGKISKIDLLRRLH